MSNRKERSRKRMKERPPATQIEADVTAGEGNPDLELDTQVREQVNTFTIDALASAAEEEVKRDERRKRHKR